MILKSLEDLERYKNSISTSKHLVSLKDINEVSEGGGESTNTCSNKLFYWNFESYYIEDLVRCYEKVDTNDINSRKLDELEIDLKYIAEEMMSENTCPIEAILYASKVINNVLLNNNLFVDTIGNVIAYIYSKNEVEYKETCPIEAILYASKSINYLLDNNLIIDTLGDIISQIYINKKEEYKDTVNFKLNEWSWNLQIIVLINACGKIEDVDLLEIIYERHTKGDNRLQALKAFMNVKKDVCVDYTLKLISLTQEVDNTEVQMAKYFMHNYIKNFGKSYIKTAEEYFNIPTINKQAKKAISRAIPKVSKVESITLNTMIKIAKNWDKEDNFEDLFSEWMKDNTTRKNAFLAIRYSNSKNVDKMIIDTLSSYKCNSVEIGTAIITLAQWGTRKGIGEIFFKLIDKYKDNLAIKVYCNAAMCSIGDESNSIELIEEFLEQRYYDRRQIFSIIRDCAYKSSHLIKFSIKKVYINYLKSNDEDKMRKAINGAYELCDNPKFNFKDIVLPEIKKAIDINNKKGIAFSEELYIELIHLVDRLLNDKNKDEFIDILFLIIENQFCSKKIKDKSIIMLKRLKVDPPR